MSPEKTKKGDGSTFPYDEANASPVYVLFNSINQLHEYYSSTTTTTTTIDAEVALNSLMELLATKNGRDVAGFYLKHGASYPKELEKALRMDISTVKSRIKKMERIGLLKKTAKLANTTGGRIPYITALVVAGLECTVNAQVRFDHVQGLSSNTKLDQYMDENADIVKQYDEHQAQEKAEAMRQDLIALVKDEHLKQYGETGKSVNIKNIRQSFLREGVSRSSADDLSETVALNLEEEGVPTVVQSGKGTAPSFVTSPAFIGARKLRDTNG